MKKKIIKKLPNASLVLVLCYSAISVGSASEENITGIYSSDFDNCFSEGYNIAELTKDQIYLTAQCFTSLLEKEKIEFASLGASKLTIMQYSDSWYRAAVEKGHKLAQAHLDSNIVAFTALEQQTHFGITAPVEQLLASEIAFNALDIDGNGLLSLSEASASKNLKKAFSKVDFDSDGDLSAGEYTILYGDMTAAGN